MSPPPRLENSRKRLFEDSATVTAESPGKVASLDRWIRIRRLETMNMCGDQNACAPLTSVADGTGDVRGSTRRKLILLLTRDALLIECLVFMISFTLPAAAHGMARPGQGPAADRGKSERAIPDHGERKAFLLARRHRLVDDGDLAGGSGCLPGEACNAAIQRHSVSLRPVGKGLRRTTSFSDDDSLAPDEEYGATSIPSYRRREITASTLHSCRCGARSTDASSAPMPNDQENSASGSARYASRTNVLWIASGEYDSINGFRIPITATQKAVLTAAARGIHEATGGQQLITVHPGVAALRLPTSTTSPG